MLFHTKSANKNTVISDLYEKYHSTLRNNLKLQFVITASQHFDDYYRKLFLKGTVMFTLCSVPTDSFICRLVNQNLPPDESFSFNSKTTN